MAAEHTHEVNVKKIDKLAPTRVRLTIELPGDPITDHEQKTAQKYQKVAKIPGFRPGKAPLNMVIQKYKEDIHKDVVSHLLEAGLGEALEKTKLNPIERPRVSFKDLAAGKPFEFEAEFDVPPQVELKQYKNIPLKALSTTPTEDEIKNTLLNLKERYASLEPCDAKKAEKGNFVVAEVSYETLEENPKKEAGKNYTVEVGTESLLPGLDKAFLEMSVDEIREIEDTFPIDYSDKSLAGKKAKFECKILEVKRKVLPEENDVFAAQIKEGATIDTLKKDIVESIERSKKEEGDKSRRNEIVEYLIKENKFEVPKSMVEVQAAHLFKNITEDFKQRGVKAPELKKEDIDSLLKRAEGMVKSSLLLREVAQKENITLDEGRFESRVDEISKQMQKTVEETKKFLDGKNITQRLRDEILTDQVFEFLIQNGKVK